MKRRIEAFHYDVIHVNQPHGYLAARALRTLNQRAVFVHRSHGIEGRVENDLAPWQRLYDIDKRPGWRRACSHIMRTLLEISEVGIARYADGHIVSASECRDFLHQQYGVSSQRIAVIPQAPPEEYRTCEARPITKERLHKILYVGQYAFVKAPMVLARAVERILAALPQATMTWICEAGDHRKARELFDDRSVLDRVTFLGWRNQSDLMG
jgi:glycosyltransferase involved in cell wall biosynthesis